MNRGPFDFLDADDFIDSEAGEFGRATARFHRRGPVHIDQRSDLPVPRQTSADPPSGGQMNARLRALKRELAGVQSDLCRGEVCMLLAEQLITRAQLLERAEPHRAQLLRAEADALVEESAALVRLHLSAKTVTIDDVLDDAERAAVVEQPTPKRDRGKTR